MLKPERHGVKRLTGTGGEAIADETVVGRTLRAAQNLVSAVTLVAEERMPQVFHVRTNLMGATCFENAFYKRHITEALKHAVVRHGVFANTRVGRINRHLHTVFLVAPNVSLNAPFIFVEVTPHEGVVTAARCFVKELPTEVRLRIGRLCYNQKSGSVFVNSMDKSYARVVRIVVGIVAKVPRNGVDERAGVVSASGMHYKARGLVDDHNVIVFIYDFQGNVFGENEVFVARTVE